MSSPEVLTISSDPEQVVLRQLIPTDATALFRLINQNREHLSQFGDITAEKYPTYESVIDSITTPIEPDKLRFGIWDYETLVGTINLRPVSATNPPETGIMGYWVGAQYSGARYAARATRTLRDYAYTELGYYRMSADVVEGNMASARTLKQAEFRLIDRRQHNEFAPAHWLFAHWQETPPEIAGQNVSHVRTLKDNHYRTIAEVKLGGMNERVINHGSDTIYMITSGVVTFARGPEVRILEPGEYIFINRGTVYQDLGVAATMLAVSQPRFRAESVEVIK